jgi:threonine/homoserine/homoserine lactone efflux protein
MDTNLFLRGFILGFSIAAPVGPIGVLCIRRTLAGGRLSGFLSGLGAATADAFYGAVAAFGLTAVSNLLVAQQVWLRLLGGGFLFYLGARTFFARTVEKPPVAENISAARLPVCGRDGKNSLLGDYLSTFGLTLTNPLTILSFAAVFAGLGLGSTGTGSALSAVLMVAGVFLGSAAWWLALSSGVGLLRARFTAREAGDGFMVWVNRLSGGVIIIFGLLAIVGL